MRRKSAFSVSEPTDLIYEGIATRASSTTTSAGRETEPTDLIYEGIATDRTPQ